MRRGHGRRLGLEPGPVVFTEDGLQRAKALFEEMFEK
jgi:hypothetical protein